MNKIVINGKEYHYPGGDIQISDGNVFVNGKTIEANIGNPAEVNIYGDVCKLECDCSVNVTGNVSGGVNCGGSCNVGGYVNGDIDAGGSVNCGKVNGSIDAGGSVICS